MAPRGGIEAAGTVPAAFAGVSAPRALLLCRFPAGTSSMGVQRRFLFPDPGGTNLRSAVSSNTSEMRVTLREKTRSQQAKKDQH